MSITVVYPSSQNPTSNLIDYTSANCSDAPSKTHRSPTFLIQQTANPKPHRAPSVRPIAPHSAPSMSFLAGRIAAAKEGSYFLQESKNAVGGLAQKLPASVSPPGPPAQPSPDVLPEILRHSVPIKGTPPPSQTSLHACSRWTLPPGEAVGVSPDALNPLRSFVSLPQATFGPKRYRCGPCSLMVFRI
jgi:hypothetical protein